LDLEAKTTSWSVVTADAKLIDGQVERIQNNLVQRSQEEVVAGADLTNVYKRRKRN
jgi:hypothetical protein